MKSLRGRLLVRLLTGANLLLAAGCVLVWFHIREKLYSEFDRNLAERAVNLAAMIEVEEDQVAMEWLESGSPAAGQGHLAGIDYFTVRLKENGAVLAGSPDLGDHSLPILRGTFARPELENVSLPGGRAGRCAGIEFEAPRAGPDDDDDFDPGARPRGANPPAEPPRPVIVQIAVARIDPVPAILSAIRRPLLGLWLALTVAGGFVVWMEIRRGLRPLDELTRQIETHEAGGSRERIDLPDAPVELAPVTAELNRLLDRVEQTLLRERTLTSNVAHELRTPIAGLLSTLELTLSRLRSPDEYRESTEECFEITKRMHWLVNNLLSMSRIESGAVQLQQAPVRVEAALREWWQPFAPSAQERSIKVVWELERNAEVETDPEFLRVVLTNLFDNAISYTPAGGTLRIRTDAGGNISVANQPVTLPPEVVNHVFDPFWRNSEEEPDRSGTHAGLGLNLCRKIMEMLGGRITARLDESGCRFIVCVELA